MPQRYSSLGTRALIGALSFMYRLRANRKGLSVNGTVCLGLNPTATVRLHL